MFDETAVRALLSAYTFCVALHRLTAMFALAEEPLADNAVENCATALSRPHPCTVTLRLRIGFARYFFRTRVRTSFCGSSRAWPLTRRILWSR
jgi:hypothetical protein